MISPVSLNDLHQALQDDYCNAAYICSNFSEEKIAILLQNFPLLFLYMNVVGRECEDHLVALKCVVLYQIGRYDPVNNHVNGEQPLPAGYTPSKKWPSLLTRKQNPQEDDKIMNSEENFTYEGMVNALAKPGDQIKQELTPLQAHQIHMAIGVSGEAGELLDAIKRGAIYQKPLDIQNVIEELGDLEFYMEGLRQSLDLTRVEILKFNVEKLSKRYKGLSYSNQAAQERADKA